jgi:hypothetical protein
MLPRLDAAQIESMGEADRELTEEGVTSAVVVFDPVSA